MSNQENISKEAKKTRRKKSQRKSQQIKLAVIMIMVSVLVLSASTFAWYKLTNTANVENMQFTADTLGNLEIAPTAENGEGDVIPGVFANSLDLELDKNANKKYLLPATTDDGSTFYSPVYDDDEVIGVSSALDEADSNFNKYVYKKQFYIKSGSVPTDKWYTLKLADGIVDSDGKLIGGTYINDLVNNDNYTAANAIRISFVPGDGALVDANDEVMNGADTVIWQPYDYSTSNDVQNGTRATDNTSGYGGYGVIEQQEDGKLVNGTICTIKEGVPALITMYVWIEGTDDDCVNQIALDTIAGQIQFVAESK